MGKCSCRQGGNVIDVGEPAAIFVRVSSTDGRQTTANQLPELQRLAAARGLEAVIYEEQESAAKARPVLDRLLVDVRQGQVQVVLVWALDRIHRSVVAAVTTVLELDRLGVPVLSLREPGPTGRIGKR